MKCNIELGQEGVIYNKSAKYVLYEEGDKHKVGAIYVTCTSCHTISTGCPKKAFTFLSIRAQSRCVPDPDHISIGPGLTETVTLFFGTRCRCHM